MPLMTEWQARQAIVTVCARMYAKGFLAATDGNVSVRLGERLVVTPSGVSKGHLKPEDMIVTDMQGRLLQGVGKPTSELMMHLCAYEARPDVRSVVHAHPPRAIAFTVAGQEIPGRMLPEVVVSLGGAIPTVPYTTPTTNEVPEAIRPFVAAHDVVMMAFHGAICLGEDPYEAYHKLEKLEHNCEVAMFARQLGTPQELTPEQIAPLLALRERMKAAAAGC